MEGAERRAIIPFLVTVFYPNAYILNTSTLPLRLVKGSEYVMDGCMHAIGGFLGWVWLGLPELIWSMAGLQLKDIQVYFNSSQSKNHGILEIRRLIFYLISNT